MYWTLFLTFVKIGMFTIGGGYAMLPLIQRDVVDRGGMTKEDFIDVFSVAPSLPGIFAVNIAIFVGYKLKKTWGGFVCALGTILPSFVIMLLMALFFTGSTLSVMSLLGGIMLIGIVVKNGIVLIDYITLCRERGLAVLNSVVTAGKSRLRPVLMTTATTVLGMIPMAIGGGQGSEMWSPMAIAVIGGLTISTVLTIGRLFPGE